MENNVTADETVYYRPIAASYLARGAYNILVLGVVLKSSIILAKMKKQFRFFLFCQFRICSFKLGYFRTNIYSFLGMRMGAIQCIQHCLLAAGQLHQIVMCCQGSAVTRPAGEFCTLIKVVHRQHLTDHRVVLYLSGQVGAGCRCNPLKKMSPCGQF